MWCHISSPSPEEVEQESQKFKVIAGFTCAETGLKGKQKKDKNHLLCVYVYSIESNQTLSFIYSYSNIEKKATNIARREKQVSLSYEGKYSVMNGRTVDQSLSLEPLPAP